MADGIVEDWRLTGESPNNKRFSINASIQQPDYDFGDVPSARVGFKIRFE